VFLGSSAGGSGDLLRLLGTFAGLPVLFFAARLLLPRLFQRAALERNQEAFALASLGSCLAVAVLAQVLGASLAFGAFLGGLVFADTPYAHQIRADLATLKDLALGFFFVTVGMLADLGYVVQHLPLVLVSAVLLLVLKTAVTALTLRVFRHPWSVAAGAGLAISQVGEFAFVLASTARSAGALGAEDHQLLIALSVLTMIVAPALVARSRPFGQAVSGWLGQPVPREWGRRAVPPRTELSEETQTLTRNARAVVVGYGPVGRTLCKILIRFGIRPTVIELNLDRVQRLRQMGREAIYGDAGQREVLHAAGVAQAGHLLITLPNLSSRVPIIVSARALNPNIHIITRARYLEERKLLEDAGAMSVAFEESEVASELARLLLSHLGVSQEQIGPEIERLRNEIALRTGYTMIGPKGQTMVREVE
jgi:CPA2 family monovalent cation:H+ antiporter-2